MTGPAGGRVLRPAGRAPRVMLRRIGRALERVAGLRRAAAWLARLADAPSVMSGGPLTGGSLGALLDESAGGTPAAGASAARRRTAAPSGLATPALRATPGPTVRPRTARRMPGIDASRVAAPLPAPAAGARVDAARLGAWAGPGAVAAPRAAAGPPRLPAASSVGAGPPVAAVADAAAVRTWATRTARRASRRLDPDPAVVAASQHSAGDAPTERGAVGGHMLPGHPGSAGAVTHGWGTPLAGPTAPGALIARLAAWDPPGRDRTGRDGGPRGAAGREHRDPGAATPTAVHHRGTHPAGGPAGGTAADSPGMPAPEPAPRDRRTLVAPSDGDRSRQTPMPVPAPGSVALVAPAAPAAPDGGFAGAGDLDDLAEKITRILDDEARRHGIPV